MLLSRDLLATKHKPQRFPNHPNQFAAGMGGGELQKEGSASGWHTLEFQGCLHALEHLESKE